MKNIMGFIFDWAGTTIDYGSLTPIYAMKRAFKQFDIELSTETIRKFMGLHKLVHIQSILKEETIKNQWESTTNLSLTSLSNEIFEKLLVATKEEAIERTKPIDGVIDFMNKYRHYGIKFGSTTGYTREMMNDIIPLATERGILFDSVVTPDEVPFGRPYPWMIYKNAINIETYPLWKMIKIGDTIADIQEGINAGMWIIALTKCGNEVGYDENEINTIDDNIIAKKIEDATIKFKEEGAHYVADSLSDTYDIINEIEEKIGYGIMPLESNK